MKAESLKLKWRIDLLRDDSREMDMDEKRLNERCPEAKRYESHDWCQYLKRIGDAPGWCKEADHPCPREVGETCLAGEDDE